MTGFIIQGIKQAAAKALGKVSKAVRFVSNTKISKLAIKGVKYLGKKLLSDPDRARWWGAAIAAARRLRKNGTAGMVGKLGTAIKNTGGFLGMMGKGMSMFDVDHRSPKEFRRDQKAKEKQVLELKKKREEMIKKENQIQDELKKPITTEGLETPEEKIDEMARHLSQMKESVGKIRANTSGTSMRLTGFEKYQIKANKNLADAIDYGSQTNMKTLAAGMEDVKEVTQAVSADSTQAIVGNISSKIDAIEEARKQEAEHRRKTGFRKKLVDGFLFVMDWVLNFWPKIIMMGLKLTALISGALYIWYKLKIKPWLQMFSGSFGDLAKVIGLKLVQAMAWLLEKVSSISQWIVGKFLDIVAGLYKYLGQALGDIPWVGKYLKKAFEGYANGIEAFKTNVYDEVADWQQDKLESLKDWAKDKAAEIEERKRKEQEAKAEKAEFDPSSIEKAGNQDSISGAFSSMEGSAKDTSSANMSPSGSGKEIKKEKKDKSLWGKAKDAMGKAAAGAINSTAEADKKYEVSETVTNRAISAMDTAKETAKIVIEKIEESDKNNVAETYNKTEKNIEKLYNKVSEMAEATKESLANNGNSKSSAPHVQGPTKINFEESSNSYRNRV